MQLSQIFLTLGLTFIILLSRCLRTHGEPRAVTFQQAVLLVAVDDAPTRKVVWAELHNHLVLWEDSDVVLAHFSRDVSKNAVAVGQLNAKHRIGQSFDYRSLDLDDAVFFCHNSLT